MRILLDEQLPRRLARELTGHDVLTVQEQGWAGVANGELLRRAAEGAFEAFVTADQNLEHQQRLAGFRIRVLVFVARSNALEDLRPLVPKLLAALPAARPGEVVTINS